MKRQANALDLAGTRGCATFNLRMASRAVAQIYDAALAPSGLRSTQFAILVAIAKTQPVSVGGLAEITVMDQTTMTRNLRPMARDGLIAISPRGAKREKGVRLTRKGTRVLAKATPAWRAMQERFVGAFGQQNWRDVRRKLEVLTGIAIQHSKA